jgi:tetratricopeptide (TPR) repeat protein
MLRWLNMLVVRLARLPLLRVPMRRMAWRYGRDRRPGMANIEKLLLIMSSFCLGLRPLGKVDPRYFAAKEIIARRAIWDIAADYDRSGIMPPGTFNLLADSATKFDLAEAEYLLLDVIADSPDFAEAHFALGSLLLDRGDRHGALVQYLLAAAGRGQILGPSVGSAINAEAYHAAGVLLAEASLPQEAEQCQRLALEADGALTRAQLAYARTLAARGQRAAAALRMGLSLPDLTS